jgi:transposase
MAKPYSEDLRARVIEAVDEGASRREAADRFAVSASSAIRWVEQFAQKGSVAAKPSGGSTSPLEQHADFLLDLIQAQPDLTLDEVVAAMRAANISGSRSAVARFYARRQISFKKKPAGGRAKAAGRGRSAPALEMPSGLA